MEGLVGVGLALVVAARARRAVAAGVGVALGVLTVVKIVDMGFFAVLARPFDPVLRLDLLRLGRRVSRAVDRPGGRIGAWPRLWSSPCVMSS